MKRAAVEGYGATVVTCEPTLAAREETLQDVVARTGAHVVHPYNDPRVIAGQGTAALELLADVPDLDVVMTPVGGGGLLSGTAIAVTGSSPGVRVLAAEPQGADDAARSLATGAIQPSVNPQTICDGLLTSLGTLTFPIIRERVHRIVTVSDDAVIEAMRLVWERMKLVVEPSAVVGLAALLEKRHEVPGARIGVIFSGGNVDLRGCPGGCPTIGSAGSGAIGAGCRIAAKAAIERDNPSWSKGLSAVVASNRPSLRSCRRNRPSASTSIRSDPSSPRHRRPGTAERTGRRGRPGCSKKRGQSEPRSVPNSAPPTAAI